MLRIFEDELMNPKNFVVTLELVPGRSPGEEIRTPSRELPGTGLPTDGSLRFPLPTTRGETRH